jgi:predicted CoA-substrate-specific enzyme activase
MITAGCDVGSLTSKAVILDRETITATSIIRSKARPADSARTVMENALKGAGLNMKDITASVGTGYGREKMGFTHTAVSEISCHSRGALFLVPSVRTIIDIGGQDCKAIRISDKGTVEHFATNDKCASGTGRFLEVMADVLGIAIDQLGPLSKRASNPVSFATACTVWAQADVIHYLNDRVAIEDIAAGINQAMASRVAVLAGNNGIEKDVCLTGGVAKNIGVLLSLEKQLGLRIKRIRKMDPQLTGALGAALYAAELAEGGSL